MAESTAPDGASTPPPGDGHPFADIIELFRGIAEGTAEGTGGQPSDEAVADAPPVAVPGVRASTDAGPADDLSTAGPARSGAAPPAAGADTTTRGEPIDRTRPGTAPAGTVLAEVAPAEAAPPPATEQAPGPPTRRGRGILARTVVALVVLALMVGTGLFLARGPFSDPGNPGDPGAGPAAGRQPSVPEAPQQREYAEVLAAVAAATDLDDLSSAAERAYDLAQTFAGLTGATPAGRRLVEAQTASLQALGGLDAINRRSAVAQFPATAPVLSEAAAGVQRARKALAGSDPATDPTAAVRNVVGLVAPLALDGLGDRLTALLDRAGTATKTAGLRDVAARAGQSRVTLEDTVAALGGNKRLLARATALQDAFASLAGLQRIDGDHLEIWQEGVRPTLAARVDALGLDAGALARVDATVATAQLLIRTWQELVDDSDVPTRADVAAYAARMQTAVDRYARAMATLPTPAPTQQYDFMLTARIRDALDAVTGAQRAVGAVDGVPDPARAEHQALVALVGRGREAARLENRVAQAVEVCLGTACGFGEMTAWPAYRSALAAVGSLDAARARWEAAVTTAERDAPATSTPKPAKPVV